MRKLFDKMKRARQGDTMLEWMSDKHNGLFCPFVLYDAYPDLEQRTQNYLLSWIQDGMQKVRRDGNSDLADFVEQQSMIGIDNVDRDYGQVYFKAGFLAAYQNVKQRIVKHQKNIPFGPPDRSKPQRHKVFSKGIPRPSADEIEKRVDKAHRGRFPFMYTAKGDEAYSYFYRNQPLDFVANHIVDNGWDPEQARALDGMMLAYRTLGVVEYARGR